MSHRSPRRVGAHGHDYDTRGGFVTDDAARRLSWSSPRHSGYHGVLQVSGHDEGSRVTMDRIDQLTRA